MTSMNTRSDAEWWDKDVRGGEAAARRRHPAGRARAQANHQTPMDTATRFHDDLRMLEDPVPPASIAECVLWVMVSAVIVLAGGRVMVAVFAGWAGPVW